MANMPRKNLIRSKIFPYHVTARVNNRECFYIPLHDVWSVLGHHCLEISILFKTQIHALVLMPNHIHLLLSTPEEDLGVVMNYFMSSVTRTLNAKSGRTGRLFGARYYRSLIDSGLYFAHALKYVYRNPVKAGLCLRVEEYPFSTLSGVLGSQRLRFPLYFPFQKTHFIWISQNIDQQLNWLNKDIREDHQIAIKKALRKVNFSLPKEGWKRSLGDLSSGLA